MVMKSSTVKSNNITISSNETNIMMQDYENVFGPSTRNIKQDSQCHKRHQRWHLPDALKGHNQYLTDGINNFITNVTSKAQAPQVEASLGFYSSGFIQ